MDMEFECFGPKIYEDLAAGSKEPLPYINGNSFGGIYPNTNLLGGTKLKNPLNSDEFQSENKKNNTKKALLWGGGLLLAATGVFLLRKTKLVSKIGNYIKSGYNYVKNKITGSSLKTKASSFFANVKSKFKNLFSKSKP